MLDEAIKTLITTALETGYYEIEVTAEHTVRLKPAVLGALDPLGGFYSVRDLAHAFHVGEAALRNRLKEDWRFEHSAAWIQSSNPAKGQAVYIYLASAVLPIITEMRAGLPKSQRDDEEPSEPKSPGSA